MLRTSGYWSIAGSGVRRGLSVCYTTNRVDRQSPTSAETATANFLATPCNPIARAKIPAGGGRVAAALDFDKQ